jgi:hypothetical protein
LENNNETKGREMTKRQKQELILEKYRMALGMSLTDFVQELKTSRQSYYSWLDGAEIKQETLNEWAITYRGKWIGELAVEILRARKSPLPCVCETQIMDHGFCPKHSNVIFTVA